MKFSVVVPVYNVERYLRKCADSILAQTFQDYELILVDDGSTDSSGALCDAIAQESGCRVIHQKNGGLGAARNTGIEAAEGEYLLFVDSDDYIAPTLMEGVAAQLERTPAEIVSFGFMTTDGERELAGYDDGTDFGRVRTLAQAPELLLALPNAWCRVVRRELFLRSGIRYPSRVWYEDIRTTLKLFALADGIVSLPDRWYYYVQRDGSITRNGNVARNREILDAFDDLLGWYRNAGLFEQYRVYLERLCIDHVCLAASVRVLRSDPKSPLLQELRQYLEREFPDYRRNPLLEKLPRQKKLAYRLLEGRHYRLLQLMFRCKDRMQSG